MAGLPVGLRGADTNQGASLGQAFVPPGAPFGRSGVGIAFNRDCRAFGSMTLTTLGSFTGAAFAVECTGDGKTWLSVQGVPIDGNSLATNWPGVSSGAGSTWIFPLWGLRVRVRVAALATGTAVFYPVFREAAASVWTAVVGQAGHGASIRGNPLRAGARAVSASYSAVATGNTADLISTLDGRLIVLPGAIPENTWSAAAVAGGVTNTTDVVVKAAAAAGIRNYLTSLHVKNVAAVASEIVVKDGAAVIWRGHVSASMAQADCYNFDPPLRGSAAAALNVAMVTTGTQTYINATGVIGT